MPITRQSNQAASSIEAAEGSKALAQTIGTACPFCQTMFRDALGSVTQTPPKLLDIAQIVASSLGPEESAAAE